jgi:hypothetical protein
MPGWAWVALAWVGASIAATCGVSWALRRGLLRFEPRDRDER